MTSTQTSNETPFEQTQLAASPDLRKRKLSILAVVGLSLAIDLAFFFATPPPPPQQDALSYDIIARLIVGYGPAEKTPSENVHVGLQGLFRRGLIYPVFLGMVYRLAGSPSYNLACLIQAFILPLTIFLTYRFGAAAFDHRCGLLAALLYALYLPAVWHITFLLTETVLGVVFTLSMWLMALFLKQQKRLTGLALGLSIGIMSVSHPVWLAMPLVFVASFFYQYRELGNRWLIARKLGFVLAGALAVLIPWHVVRVAAKLPQLGEGGTGFGAGGGFTFYAGSRVETRGMTVPEDYVVVETYFPPERLRDLYDQMQRNEIKIEPILASIIAEKLASDDSRDWTLTDFDYYRAGIECWLHKPFRIPELLGYKIYWYLLDIATSPTYPLPHTALHNQAWRTSFKFLNWPGVGLTLFGLFIVARRYRDKLILFAPLVVHTVSILLTYPDNRYKYPVLSAAFVLLAVALQVIWARARGTSAATATG